VTKMIIKCVPRSHGFSPEFWAKTKNPPPD
jgi:hypothetical protein